MKIKEYYQQLNAKSQEILSIALTEPGLLSKVHSGTHEIFQLAELLKDRDEQAMLKAVCSQLEVSCLTLSLGLYRPAISSLRLGLELAVGCMYFSANKLAHREWINNGDLKWGVVNSDADGALSVRFTKAFFPELAEDSAYFRELSNNVYRTLSEYVHGNNDTWSNGGIVLSNNENLRKLYADKFEEILSVIKFSFCCRHMKELSADSCEIIHSATAEIHHIAPIREYLGGPEEIK